jgi:hypothetical protein
MFFIVFFKCFFGGVGVVGGGGVGGGGGGGENGSNVYEFLSNTRAHGASLLTGTQLTTASSHQPTLHIAALSQQHGIAPNHLLQFQQQHGVAPEHLLQFLQQHQQNPQYQQHQQHPQYQQHQQGPTIHVLDEQRQTSPDSNFVDNPYQDMGGSGLLEDGGTGDGEEDYGAPKTKEAALAIQDEHERRRDPDDGRWYTQQEFQNHYHDWRAGEYWDRSHNTSTVAQPTGRHTTFREGGTKKRYSKKRKKTRRRRRKRKKKTIRKRRKRGRKTRRK